MQIILKEGNVFIGNPQHRTKLCCRNHLEIGNRALGMVFLWGGRKWLVVRVPNQSAKAHYNPITWCQSDNNQGTQEQESTWARGGNAHLPSSLNTPLRSSLAPSDLPVFKSISPGFLNFNHPYIPIMAPHLDTPLPPRVFRNAKFSLCAISSSLEVPFLSAHLSYTSTGWGYK